jgi:SAM-dependent methyltransferase
LVLEAVPVQCERALDAGCGNGTLAKKLARRCGHVVGIDTDGDVIRAARAATPLPPNLELAAGSVLTEPLKPGSFDFVTAVASLHHMELEPALERFSALLRPGGKLAVVGLYRPATLWDYASCAAALPVSLVVRGILTVAKVQAKIAEPHESLKEIGQAAKGILPGCSFRRLFFFRYWLEWRKTGERADR